MQIPILSGIYTDEASDFRTGYPVNMIPVPKEQGISKGYLRPAEGIVEFAVLPGIDRGGREWNGYCYRVAGTKLVRVTPSGAVEVLGDVGSGGQVRMDNSFDRLGIAAGGKLFYWDGGTLTQVTDADLGAVVSMIWIDGYWMTTDGSSLVTTQLNDPTSVLPFKYGSSEVDPDPVKGLIKHRNEACAFNRYTAEFFQNVGGSVFPFQRIDGAQLQRGALGAHCYCLFMEEIAFLGSARNEAPAIWLGAHGNTEKISTREVEQLIRRYSEGELSLSVMETRSFDEQHLLYLHLADRTLVFDGAATKAAGQPVWHVLTSALAGFGPYRGRNFVYCYNKFLCGDTKNPTLGYMTDKSGEHFGDKVGWNFGTTIIYNEGKGAIFNELELVGLTGRAAVGEDPTIWTQYSYDGETWSQEKAISAGRQGERAKRLRWLRQGRMTERRIQRFRGTSDARDSFARLNGGLEALNV